jgi:hypothetical protein
MLHEVKNNQFCNFFLILKPSAFPLLYLLALSIPSLFYFSSSRFFFDFCPFWARKDNATFFPRVTLKLDIKGMVPKGCAYCF